MKELFPPAIFMVLRNVLPPYKGCLQKKDAKTKNKKPKLPNPSTENMGRIFINKLASPNVWIPKNRFKSKT